jgi:acetyltransferase-like isoleucine patch superfamily enzyme
MTAFEEQHHLPPNPYNPHAWIIGAPEIGDGTWIGAFTVIDGSGGLRIGANCDISAGAQIYTHSTVQRCLSSGVSDVERAATTLGDRVHVGAGAVILMGASIGSNSVVGAGCVVPQFTDIPPGSVVVGVPARIVGSTDDLLGASSPSPNDEDRT